MATKNDNTPAIQILFDKYSKLDGQKEGLGRDIILDFFNNADQRNLSVLALGTADTKAPNGDTVAGKINTALRMEWLYNNIISHKEDVDARNALGKRPNKGASSQQKDAYDADHLHYSERIEARRQMINRAVPAAFQLYCHNAADVHFIGSKKNKILWNYIGDMVDTVVNPAVKDDNGNDIPVKRGPATYTTGALVEAGNGTIASRQAHAVKTGNVVKVAATRAPAKKKNVKASTTLAVTADTVEKTAETLAQSLANTAGDKLTTVSHSPQIETLLCNAVRARFAKFDKVTGVMKSVDIGELFTWLRTQSFFEGVQWTGHASTAELIKAPIKPVANGKKTATK